MEHEQDELQKLLQKAREIDRRTAEEAKKRKKRKIRGGYTEADRIHDLMDMFTIGL